MSKLLNIDTMTLFNEFADEDSSSEEDAREDYVQLGDLYEHIGVPNPLPEEKRVTSMEVRTAYSLNFTKLPEEIYTSATTSEFAANKMVEEVTLSLDNLRKINDDSTKDKQATLAIPDTLFSLYPQNDSRLVYRKYKDQGDWEMKTKCYASYLVNISNLIDNKQGKVQYEENKEEDVYGKAQIKLSNTLNFDSKFESGNLFAAYKISEYEYDLILQNDINTKGNTQWFFFSVSNMLKGRTVKFNIVNLLKPESLFNQGMKPAVFSCHENVIKGQGWKRSGLNVSYYRNNIDKEGTFNKSYYTLSFSYTFSYSNDTVYFAHSYPYTYSNLKDFLNRLCNDPTRKPHIVRRTLCQTLCKNECEYLSITSPSDLENIEQRCGIVISARQHPGESLSSYMMEGFLEFITSDDPEAVSLRSSCVFKVVPMLNPDGVIHGNYRTSLCGRDLNRIWNKPNPTLHPTIYHTKELIRRMESRRRLRLICDLHGHSRKKNAFFYGNATDDNPYNARVFPMIVSKLSKYVSFEDCRFVIQKSKEKTARIALWKELRIDNVFTLEASFYGYDQENEVKAFSKEEYRKLGADLGKSLYVYLKDVTSDIKSPQLPMAVSEDILEEGDVGYSSKSFLDRNKKKSRRSMSTNLVGDFNHSVMRHKQSFVAEKGSPEKGRRQEPRVNFVKIIEEMKKNKQLIEIGNKAEDSGSDTDNSEDDIPDKELKKVLPVKVVVKPKKKKNKQIKKKNTFVIVSKKEEKKEEEKEREKDREKERKTIPAKVDSSTNTTGQAYQEKTIEPTSAKKVKTPLRKIFRESVFKNRMTVAEPGQEAPVGVEMVSKGSQTDDVGYNGYDQLDTSLERNLNKGINIFEPRGWSQPNMGQNVKQVSSAMMTKGTMAGKLFVVGAKTGIDTSGGIDVNYKLGKNQVSRSILAKVPQRQMVNENRQEQQTGQKRKVESVSTENNQSAQKKQKIIVSKLEGSGLKSTTSATNSLHYYLYYKDEPKLNTLTAESYNRDSTFNVDRFEDAKLKMRKEPSSKTPVKDLKEVNEYRKSVSLKNLENKDVENQNVVPASSCQIKFSRLNSKEKPSVPLPRLLRAQHNKSEVKEPLMTDLSGVMNNSIRKGANNEEEAPFFKAKNNKLPSNNPAAAGFLGSFRDLLQEKSDVKREKLSLGLIREYSGLSSRFIDSSNTQTPKNQEKSSKKEKNSSKLERVLSSDVKFDVERKGEFDPFSTKGRKSQNSILRKI